MTATVATRNSGWCDACGVGFVMEDSLQAAQEWVRYHNLDVHSDSEVAESVSSDTHLSLEQWDRNERALQPRNEPCKVCGKAWPIAGRDTCKVHSWKLPSDPYNDFASVEQWENSEGSPWSF